MRIVLPRKTALLLCIFFCPFFCLSQLSEKIHLQTDKDIYFPGETIWFKSFVYFANKPSAASTNFYIGIYDNAGLLIQQKKLPLIDGSSEGEFTIPDSINSSFIRLAVQTINSKENIVKLLPVYRPGKPFEIPDLPGYDEMTVKIFAENINPVPAVNSHFILQATQKWQGREIAAAIYDQQHRLIDSVFTSKHGYASLQLTIKPGEKYYAEWKDEKGLIRKTEFPATGSKAIALHIEQANNALFYNIQYAERSADFEKLAVQLINGEDTLYKASILPRSQKQVTGSVPLDSVQKGLAFLQLLDNNGLLLQQNPVLLESSKFLPVVHHSGKSFAPKGKNIIEISGSDLASYNLSLSIIDCKFSNDLYNSSLYDGIWSVNPIGFGLYDAITLKDQKYIQNVTAAYNEKRELVTEKQKQDNYLQWDIEQKDKATLPKGSKASLILSDNSGRKQFLNLEPVDRATFKLEGVVVYDSAKLYYNLLNDKSLSGKLNIHSVGNDIGMPTKIAAMPTKIVEESMLNSAAGNTDYLLPEEYYTKKPSSFNTVQTIQTVVVKSKKINPVTQRLMELEDRYTSGLSKGMARGYQLNVLDDPNAENSVDLFTFLSTRLGMFIRGQLGSRALEFLRGATSGESAIPVLFVDDTESSWDILERYQASHLAYVKAIPGIVITPTGTSTTGVLYVYTRKGKDIKTDENKGMRSFKIKGYDSNKEFVSPDYAGSSSLTEPDYRSTLYWNPYLNVEGKTNIKIEYYNNDVARRHLLILKGFDAEGLPFEIRQILE